MECEQLKEENQRLIYENTHLKEENYNLMERCKKLEDSKAVTENKLNILYFTQASLREDDAKSKYYTGLPNFAVLMALFNFLSLSVEIGN